MSGHFEKGVWIDDGGFPFINKPKNQVLGIAGEPVCAGSLVCFGPDEKVYLAPKIIEALERCGTKP